MDQKISFDSICARGPKVPNWNRPHLMPMYASSTYEFDSLEESIEVFTGQRQGHIYGRYGNPNVDAVAQKIADLESYDIHDNSKALLTSSGMSAMSTLISALLESGDTILLSSDLYGGTFEFVNKVCIKWGIKALNVSFSDLSNIERVLLGDSSISMMVLETPSNPLLNVYDLQAIADLAHEHNCVTVVDNTFCTPYLQRPFNYGIDYITHSTTKFLNGHGSGVTGIVVSRNAEHIDDKIWPQMKLLGTNTSPFEAWLINLGLKTLSLRMARHVSNADSIAKFLEDHGQVEKVNYPGLTNHPDFELAKSQMLSSGGFVSFSLKGGMSHVHKFMRNTSLFTIAPSFGDTSSLIMHPATSSHMHVPKEIREPLGITDSLIRLAIGLEDPMDLISDLNKALEV